VLRIGKAIIPNGFALGRFTLVEGCAGLPHQKSAPRSLSNRYLPNNILEKLQ